MAESAKTVTVQYTTNDGSAEQPGDYTSASGTLTFAAGDEAKTIEVVTRTDELDEADGETFTVTLSSPSNATLATNGKSATGKINDNDVLSAEVSADEPSVAEGDSATFTVEVKDGTSTDDVVVAYTVGGSATAPGGLHGAGRRTEDRVGESSGTITIETLDTDAVLDPGETLQVKLTGASTDGRTVTVDDTVSVTTTITDAAR